MPVRLSSALIWFLVAPLFGSLASCSNDGNSGSDGGDESATSSGGSGIGGSTATSPNGANTGGSTAAAPSGTSTGGSGLEVSSGGSSVGDGSPAVPSGGSATGGTASSSAGSGGALPTTGGASTGLATGGTYGATGGAENPASGSGGVGSEAVGGADSTLATGGNLPSSVGGGGPAGAGGTISTAGETGLGGTAPAGGTGGSPDGGLSPLIGAVAFSVPSQTFQGQLQVGLSTSNASAEIHYTTSGLLPTVDDPVYAGTPLELAATTQLRAQAFVGGLPAGQPSTAIYILRNFDYTSDIPIVVMEGYGGGKPPNKEDWLDLAFMTFEPTDGVADLANLPTLATRAGYHLRGQSSSSFPKAPYRVELWDNDGSDEDYPVLGMPAESDWAMIGPCADNSLLRNAFIYDLAADMGLATMRMRFAEVFINQDDSPLEEADYEGVYAVTETVKNQKNRLNLKQLEPEDTTLPDITGGYIFKFDQAAVDEGEAEILCTPVEGTEDPVDGTGGGPGFGFGFGGGMVDGCWVDLELVDPDPINAEQTAWITAHIQTLHDLMHTEPLGDYQSMINVGSFVDNMIINEITRNVDAYIRSHFLYKDRDGLVTAGPVWDYNFSLGEVGTDLEGWQWEEGRAGPTDWHTVMATDPAFWAQVVTRWQELRPGILSDEQLLARIDALSAPLVNAGPRDNARWPVGECFSWAMGGGDSPYVGDGTWEGEVQVLKDWLLARMAWIDGQLLTASSSAP